MSKDKNEPEATRSLFQRMYDHQRFQRNIEKLDEEIKERMLEKNELQFKQDEIEQDFKQELTEAGLDYKYLAFTDGKIFLIYPGRVEVIQTESGF